MSALLEVEQARRQFGSGAGTVVALAEADLVVEPGEFVALVGASGSGKSTLLRLCGGLDQPTSGTVRIAGQDLADLDPPALARLRRQVVGYVFQELNLLPVLRAWENVALPLELDGAGRSTGRAAALAALEAVGLGHRLEAFPDDLSGGERQRVAIARAMVGERRLLLADEPTGALDSATGAEIVALLRRACQAGAAVVVVTHDPEVASSADRTVAMHDGTLSNRVMS